MDYVDIPASNRALKVFRYLVFTKPLQKVGSWLMTVGNVFCWLKNYQDKLAYFVGAPYDATNPLHPDYDGEAERR